MLRNVINHALSNGLKSGMGHHQPMIEEPNPETISRPLEPSSRWSPSAPVTVTVKCQLVRGDGVFLFERDVMSRCKLTASQCLFWTKDSDSAAII